MLPMKQRSHVSELVVKDEYIVPQWLVMRSQIYEHYNWPAATAYPIAHFGYEHYNISQ